MHHPLISQSFSMVFPMKNIIVRHMFWIDADTHDNRFVFILTEISYTYVDLLSLSCIISSTNQLSFLYN